MSRIYFHHQGEDANPEISGAERGWLSSICDKMFLFSLGDLRSWGNEPCWILKYIVTKDFYLHNPSSCLGSQESSIETWLRVGDMGHENEGLTFEGEKQDLFSLKLNSAIKFGSRPIKLAARLHGQCEIHCWIAGENRSWLADIIQEGLDSNLYRPDMGWEQLVEFLRKPGGEVVCSYSVCDQFPNAHTADYYDEKTDNESWYDLDHKIRWDMAFENLKQDEYMELKPENFDDYYFGNGITGADILSQEWKKK